MNGPATPVPVPATTIVTWPDALVTPVTLWAPQFTVIPDPTSEEQMWTSLHAAKFRITTLPGTALFDASRTV